MFIPYTNSAVRLTGRWNTAKTQAITTAPGAMIEIAFSGKYIVLEFDTNDCANPLLHLWVILDNKNKIETVVDKYIRIEAGNEGDHLLTVIFKGAVETFGRWQTPLSGGLFFVGAEAQNSAILPEDTRPIIQFIGDSITEGVLIDADLTPLDVPVHNRVYQDDSTATYAYLTAVKLGMKPVIMGYGAVGVTKGGNGGVPKALEAYPFNFEGSPILPIDAKITVINHGANDFNAPEEEYVKCYAELLDVVRKLNPNTKIVALSAFCGAHNKALENLIENYNKEKNEAVLFIDSSDWLPPTEPLHPSRDGHKAVSEKLYEILKNL